jgi:zinc/manganese transport system permease protein
MIETLALPFFQTAVLATLVLAGLHAYLGFHIVRRGVLFVDLALAQMAALGVAVALMLGKEPEDPLCFVMALGMTFLGAGLFAWLRGRSRNVPLEAFIGIVFATAQAVVFLLLEKSPSGAEHMKETMVGSLFTLDPKHIIRVAMLYAGIGVAHFFLRKPFFELTNDPRGAIERGRRVFFWDFLFYATFGMVVTVSVQIAGVLLVFGLLVIPAVAGLMTTQRTGLALAIGWVFGFTSGVVGLLGSVQWDLPAAPSILVTLAAMLVLHAGILGLVRMRRPATARVAAPMLHSEEA